MFRLSTVGLTTLQTNPNIHKIRVLLSKTLADCKNEGKTSYPSVELILKKKIQSKTQPQSIQQVYQKLKNGHLVQKHSRNTKQPHIKLVYLSKDNKWLCWKSIDREDQKKLPLSSIIKLVKQGNKNFIRSNLTLKDPTCCVIIVSTARNLQLETTSEYQADLLRYQLNRVLKYSQQMSQNYLYHRK